MAAKPSARKPAARQPEPPPAAAEASPEAQPPAALAIEMWPIGRLVPYHGNPRLITDEAVDKVASAIAEYGWRQPIVVDRNGVIVVGHTRLKAARKLGQTHVPVHVARELTEAQAKAYRIADNRAGEFTTWDARHLQLELDSLADLGLDGFKLTGFDQAALDTVVAADPVLGKAGGTGARAGQATDEQRGRLKEAFGVPPFSILDTRQGYWRERAAVWGPLIGDGGESRKNVLGAPDNVVAQINDGTSLLDPVLAEMLVAWFTKRGDAVFDPFAGDTAFGYVAGSMGRRFVGTELRAEQVAINNERTEGLGCTYINDDAANLLQHVAKGSQDFVFSCPPYGDLEVYSDNPRDLSTMKPADFMAAYERILHDALATLAKDRFAAIVIGEVRVKGQFYQGLVPWTIQVAENAGCGFYNEAILVNAVGTAAIRAGRQMNASRKLCRIHQNVLVFCKGDPVAATKRLGDVEVPMPDGDGAATRQEYSDPVEGVGERQPA